MLQDRIISRLKILTNMIAYFTFLRFVTILEAGYFRSDFRWSGWVRFESNEGLFYFWLGVARVHAKDFGTNHGWVELPASGWGRTASGELWTVISISFLN